MNKLIINSLLLTAFFFSQQSIAEDDIQAASNINDFSYPSHNCNNKPVKPVKPEEFNASEDVEAYNNMVSEYNVQVSSYNKKIKTYKACINQYIKNGNNDIQTIRKQLNAALKEARSR